MFLKVLIASIALCSAVSVNTAIGQVIALPASETALLGRFARGPMNLPLRVGAGEFEATFSSGNAAAWPAEAQARQYFANGGAGLHVVRIADTGSLAAALTGGAEDLSGIFALEPLSNLRLLIAPELSLLASADLANSFETFRAFLQTRRIFLILDPPPGLASVNDVASWVDASVPADASFCSLYYPYLKVVLDGAPLTITAGGAMAAIYAKNDSVSGIWRSPSGTSLPIQAQATNPVLSASESDFLTTHNIDPIRQFSGIGIVPWAARTLDRTNTGNRFISVVRTRAWVAASIERALAFAATQDNAAPLWTEIRDTAGAFLNSLYQQGAFAGSTPAQAYFVRCDATTTSAADIAAHRVNLLYGIALLQPSEFDVTQLSATTYDSQRPVPVPKIRVRNEANNLLPAYQTIAGFSYTLELSADLESSSWTGAAPTVTGDGAWFTPVIPMSESRGFYRLRVTPAMHD